MGVKCPSCGSYATVTETRYGLRNDCCGLWSWGDKPLVDAETHQARKNAHLYFDELWEYYGFTRSSAYKLLAKYLPEGSETHMSNMSKQECAMVPEAVEKILNNHHFVKVKE